MSCHWHLEPVVSVCHHKKVPKHKLKKYLDVRGMRRDEIILTPVWATRWCIEWEYKRYLRVTRYINVKAGSKGKEHFRRPLRGTRDPGPRAVPHASCLRFGTSLPCTSRAGPHIVSLCSLHHLAQDRLGMVPMFGWSHAKTRGSSVISALFVSPLYTVTALVGISSLIFQHII